MLDGWGALRTKLGLGVLNAQTRSHVGHTCESTVDITEKKKPLKVSKSLNYLLLAQLYLEHFFISPKNAKLLNRTYKLGWVRLKV